jgi:hypothetical protein
MPYVGAPAHSVQPEVALISMMLAKDLCCWGNHIWATLDESDSGDALKRWLLR